MKKYLVFIILLVGQLSFGIEVSRTNEVSSDGENITTILYKNDPKQVQKIVRYGKEPIYRLEEVFYEPSNPSYLDHCESHEVRTNDPRFPNGLPAESEFYFVTNNPEHYIKWVRILRGEAFLDTYYYQDNNSKYLTTEEVLRSFKFEDVVRDLNYVDSESNKHKKKTEITYFPNKQVQYYSNEFYPNDNHLLKLTLEFDGVKYNFNDNHFIKAIQTYSNDPQGRTELTEELADDGIRDILLFDIKITKGNINKVITFKRSNGVIFRIIDYYVELKDGKFTGMSTLYNSDGTKTITYFDANGNELVDEATTIPAK